MVRYKNPKVVAEIGCNHMGDFEIAKKMIRAAKQCGAYFVKFQKEHLKNCLLQNNIIVLIRTPQIHLEKLMENIENF